MERQRGGKKESKDRIMSANNKTKSSYMIKKLSIITLPQNVYDKRNHKN